MRRAGGRVLRFQPLAALSLLGGLALVAACGGGGDGSPGASVTPAPTVSISAAPASVIANNSATLTWSSTNASACTASGGWSGSEPVSGTAVTAAVAVTTIYTLTCTGTGGSASNSTTVSVAPSGSLTVSGQVTFDRVPFSATARGGLDYTRTTPAPARGVSVEGIAASNGSVLASATTDASGLYSFVVAPNTDLFVRVKAQMQRAGSPGWSFSVRDNTALDALYALDGTVFNTGTASITRNLNAASGWGGSSYIAPRSAAPFAILDAVYLAYSLVLTANASAAFPTLQLEWSTRNVPSGDGSAAALASGQIGTTFFAAAANGNPARIYVLGAADTDTDEFDPAVIAHEWGHYYQNSFSRDDNLGGNHALGDRLDLRVAFSEGWGNAFSGMARNDPIYRDSSGVRQASDFSFNVEMPSGPSVGWYSEESVQSIFWELFDGTNEPPDFVNLGFAPIHAAMTGGVRSTAGFTSIYPLLAAVRSANPNQASGIGQLASAHAINASSDDFGTNEANSGGDARNLPIYAVLNAGATLPQVCSTVTNGSYNRLGNRKFLRFVVSGTRSATIIANNGPTGSDPDLVLYAMGVEKARAESTTSGSETLAVSNLGAGTYVVELYEYSNIAKGAVARGDTCFDVQLTLN